MHSDGALEEGSWTFKSSDVAGAFDGYVRQQLPWYDLASGIVKHFVRAYLPDNGVLVDVGASTGNIGRTCADILDKRKAKLMAIEPSSQMCDVYDAPGEVFNCVTREFSFEECDVAAWFLTAQFLSRSERISELQRCADQLKNGGALIVFDRFEGAGGYVGQVSSRLAMAGKYEAGATPDEIVRKELSLVGIQRPLMVEELPAKSTEVFRCGDFAGYVIEIS